MKPITKIGLIVTTIAFLISGAAYKFRRKPGL